MKDESFCGKYCSGTGNAAFLKLIEESFTMMHPSPELPNISMLYNPEQNTFAEGFFWNGWWIQNSYGFAYSAVPFLSEPWVTILQNSLDLFWDRMGDGKRTGAEKKAALKNRIFELVAPDGCLGDCVIFDQGIVYKQGDGEIDLHDWFYEATTAGIIMQSELLLRSHDLKRIEKYLPLLERSCDCIERIRDSNNNLFLAGPSSNLLAPSYGGVLNNDGTIGKGYPSGLAITYIAALRRMCELFNIANNQEKQKEYKQRVDITLDALRLLKTNDGYFVKSMEPDGTLHGVYGEKKYGYIEGVANADAIAFDVADEDTKKKIYDKISMVNGIRPYDFLLTNYPELDDTYEIYLGKGHHGFFEFGDWVNGGCWGTVEGRAILSYLKLNKFDDVFKSASRAMDWAKEYRMDAPFSQRGENTYNPWSDRKDVSPVSVMVDNFAIPAATIRGLFEYNISGKAITLIPHIPTDIQEYVQHEPVWFGEKRLYISVVNGNAIKKVVLNGKEIASDFQKGVTLDYSSLPAEAYIFIDMSDVSHHLKRNSGNQKASELDIQPDISTLSPELINVYSQFKEITNQWNKNVPSDFKTVYASEVLQSIESCALRRQIPFKKDTYLRPMTEQKMKDILSLYDNAALALANGYSKIN